jgi:hypothetical protein
MGDNMQTHDDDSEQFLNGEGVRIEYVDDVEAEVEDLHDELVEYITAHTRLTNTDNTVEHDNQHDGYIATEERFRDRSENLYVDVYTSVESSAIQVVDDVGRLVNETQIDSDNDTTIADAVHQLLDSH